MTDFFFASTTTGTLNDEHRYLLATPPLFFERVARVIRMEPLAYRSHVLETSLTSIAYLQMEVWSPLSEAPRKYSCGDARRNVALLVEEEGVTDPVAIKMQALARLGCESNIILRF